MSIFLDKRKRSQSFRDVTSVNFVDADHVILLGVTLDNHLTFDKHVNVLSKTCSNHIKRFDTSSRQSMRQWRNWSLARYSRHARAMTSTPLYSYMSWCIKTQHFDRNAFRTASLSNSWHRVHREQLHRFIGLAGCRSNANSCVENSFRGGTIRVFV